MSLVLLGRGTPRRQEFHKVVTYVGGLLGHQVQFPQKENILLTGLDSRLSDGFCSRVKLTKDRAHSSGFYSILQCEIRSWQAARTLLVSAPKVVVHSRTSICMAFIPNPLLQRQKSCSANLRLQKNNFLTVSLYKCFLYPLVLDVPPAKAP